VNRGSKPAWANSSRDPISKITRAKEAGGMAQVVEHLLCKHTALGSFSKCFYRMFKKKKKTNQAGDVAQ
jgi:hypothetical protein